MFGYTKKDTSFGLFDCKPVMEQCQDVLARIDEKRQAWKREWSVRRTRAHNFWSWLPFVKVWTVDWVMDHYEEMRKSGSLYQSLDMDLDLICWNQYDVARSILAMCERLIEQDGNAARIALSRDDYDFIF